MSPHRREKTIRPGVSTPRRYLSSRLRTGTVPQDSGRQYLCACCRKRVLICRRCDRGNLYCGKACSDKRRHEAQREAGRRYQQSGPGRRNHARREQRYRDSEKQKVTHQGPKEEPETAKGEVSTERPRLEAQKEETDAPTAPCAPGPAVQPAAPCEPEESRPRCQFCQRLCSPLVRCRPLGQCRPRGRSQRPQGP